MLSVVPKFCFTMSHYLTESLTNIKLIKSIRRFWDLQTPKGLFTLHF